MSILIARTSGTSRPTLHPIRTQFTPKPSNAVTHASTRGVHVDLLNVHSSLLGMSKTTIQMAIAMDPNIHNVDISIEPHGSIEEDAPGLELAAVVDAMTAGKGGCGAVVHGRLLPTGEVKPARGAVGVVMAAIHAGIPWVVLDVVDAMSARHLCRDPMSDATRILSAGTVDEAVLLVSSTPAGEAARMAQIQKQDELRSRPQERWEPNRLEFLPNTVAMHTTIRALQIAAVGFHSILLQGDLASGSLLGVLARSAQSFVGVRTGEWEDRSAEMMSLRGTLAASRDQLCPPFVKLLPGSSYVEILGGSGINKRPSMGQVTQDGVLFIANVNDHTAVVLETVRTMPGRFMTVALQVSPRRHHMKPDISVDLVRLSQRTAAGKSLPIEENLLQEVLQARDELKWADRAERPTVAESIAALDGRAEVNDADRAEAESLRSAQVML